MKRCENRINEIMDDSVFFFFKLEGEGRPNIVSCGPQFFMMDES